jgi:hypothetical protein
MKRRCAMRKGMIAVAIIVCTGVLALAPCYYSDSPDCLCFDDTAAWDPTGTWIQDIALDTVGTKESCVSDGGKPFYQMRLGLNSRSSATEMATVLEWLSGFCPPLYEREAWCSETISYWHREAGIPYSTGYRGSTWLLDWQLTNTGAIRTFYLVEEQLGPLLGPIAIQGGRGRWIDWSDLDYSDFRPGINAPAPGSYVLMRKYDDATATWIDGKYSHSMMINEMTIHRNASWDVVRVEVSLLDGNWGNQVRDTGTLEDLIAYTPAGSRWFDTDRKILGFAVDLDSSGFPIYDPDRRHLELDLDGDVPRTKSFPTKDPMWERFYAPLVQELVDYAVKVKDGPKVTGPSSVIGKGLIPDGKAVAWVFGSELSHTQAKAVEIAVDLLQDHPLLLKGIALCWEGTIPTGYSVRYAADGQRYKEVSAPDIGSLALSSQRLSTVLIPIAFGEESTRVRMLQLCFPAGSLPGEAKLTELRFIYDWGPGKDAEFNPSVPGLSSSEALSISVSASASEAHGMAYSHVLVVSWKVTGGTASYQLAIKVTGPDGIAAVEDEEALEGTRRFELTYPDGGTVVASVEVRDAAGSIASGMTSVSLVDVTP